MNNDDTEKIEKTGQLGCDPEPAQVERIADSCKNSANLSKATSDTQLPQSAKQKIWWLDFYTNYTDHISLE